MRYRLIDPEAPARDLTITLSGDKVVSIDELCPRCKAHLANWEEVFHEKHVCIPTLEEQWIEWGERICQ